MSTLVGLGFLLCNLVVLALNLKLYTQILKEKSQRSRVAQPNDGGE